MEREWERDEGKSPRPRRPNECPSVSAFPREDVFPSSASPMPDPNLSSFLWSVADLLRGDYRQSEYGKVILPFSHAHESGMFLGCSVGWAFPLPPDSKSLRRINVPPSQHNRAVSVQCAKEDSLSPDRGRGKPLFNAVDEIDASHFGWEPSFRRSRVSD